MTTAGGERESGRGAPVGRAEATVFSPVPHPAKILHWLTAAAVLALFVTGVMMKQIGDGATADALHRFHKSIGAGVLGLVAIRLGYRLFAQASGRWHRKVASRPVHVVLYGMLILVPLLGWAGVSDFGARDVLFGLSLPAIWPEGAGHADRLFLSHAWLAFAVIALVVVHVGFALGDYLRRGADEAGRAD